MRQVMFAQGLGLSQNLSRLGVSVGQLVALCLVKSLYDRLLGMSREPALW